MVSTAWSKGKFNIVYSDPQIQGFGDSEGKEKAVNNVDEIMYFYYSIEVSYGGKTLFSARACDFLKVDQLGTFIDSILNFDMSQAYVLEHKEDKVQDYERTVRYHKGEFTDFLDRGFDYFYNLERYDYEIRNEQDETEHTRFNLTIGKQSSDSHLDEELEFTFGEAVAIRALSKKDLEELKKVAEEFCNQAILDHQKQSEED